MEEDNCERRGGVCLFFAFAFVRTAVDGWVYSQEMMDMMELDFGQRQLATRGLEEAGEAAGIYVHVGEEVGKPSDFPPFLPPREA
jgi:hypothetical protein